MLNVFSGSLPPTQSHTRRGWGRLARHGRRELGRSRCRLGRAFRGRAECDASIRTAPADAAVGCPFSVAVLAAGYVGAYMERDSSWLFTPGLARHLSSWDELTDRE